MAAGDPGVLKRNFSAVAIETTLVNNLTSAATGDTTTSVAVVSVSGFPTAPFTLILGPDTSKEEVVTCVSVVGTTLQIVRGQDSTGAVAHTAGTAVRHGVSGRDFKEEQTHQAARGYDADTAILSSGGLTHVHGLVSGDGSVVGADQSVTLTRKTLTTPTINGATLTGTVTSTASIVVSGAGTITGLSSAGMSTSSATPKSYVDAILGSATAASTSATSAATSATSAAASATAAATSATSAAASATAAATSASSALTSQTAAATSATSAAASATAAATSATSSATSATASASSASAAATSASSAATSASSAATSATAAATSATSAAASATDAATSAASAAAAMTNAVTKSTYASTGSILVASAASTPANLSIATTSGWVLASTGTTAAWAAPAASYTAPTLGTTVVTSGTTISNLAAVTINSTTIPSSKTLVVTTDKISVLAATTSAELAGVISDETGSGALVFGTTPTISSPKISSTYTAKTAAYTFASGDEGQLFSMNNAASVQFNIPTDATFNFAVGTEINVFWITGAGQPTIGAVTPGTTTVISTGGTSATPKLRVANSGATCKKLAANSWIVFGDIS